MAIPAWLAASLLAIVFIGDLKPENLLLSAEGVLKIADFGSSRYAGFQLWRCCAIFLPHATPELMSVVWHAFRGLLVGTFACILAMYCVSRSFQHCEWRASLVAKHVEHAVVPVPRAAAGLSFHVPLSVCRRHLGGWLYPVLLHFWKV